MKYFFAIVMLLLMSSISFAADQVKVLIIDGVNNHDCSWVVRHPGALIDWLDRYELCQKNVVSALGMR